MVAGFRPGRVLLVGSERGIARTGVLDRPGDRLGARLGGLPVDVFSGFGANPVLEDVLDGARVLRDTGAGLVVAVGGGSAMDTAKMVRLLPTERRAAIDVLRGAPLGEPAAPPLVVVPTTAGTGSEVTRFATVYVDGRKHSLDTPRARPDVAVVDPLLTATCPPALTFSCAFDALAHALESYWSVRSTPESRRLAEEAARELAELIATRRVLTDRVRRSALAIQAGLAIDRTRTTVGHAFAYPLTVRYGIPHGLACALALSFLLPVAAGAECRDPRGPGFVADRLAGLADILRAGSPGRLGWAMRELLTAAGFATDLGAHGVRSGDVAAIVGEALGANRAGNSPVVYERDTAARALRAAL